MSTSQKVQLKVLKGLGLASLGVTKSRLRKATEKKKRANKFDALVKDLTCRISRQTPSSRIFLCDRNGQFESLYNDARIVFTEKPLVVEEVAGFGEKLYGRIQSGEMAVRSDGAGLTCAHLVVLDAKKKTAHYAGNRTATRHLERTLRPFVNFTRRTRTKSSDFHVAENVALLEQRRRRLARLFANPAAPSVGV
jgi:hypothetical protein